MNQLLSINFDIHYVAYLKSTSVNNILPATSDIAILNYTYHFCFLKGMTQLHLQHLLHSAKTLFSNI